MPPQNNDYHTINSLPANFNETSNNATIHLGKKLNVNDVSYWFNTWLSTRGFVVLPPTSLSPVQCSLRCTAPRVYNTLQVEIKNQPYYGVKKLELLFG